MKAALLGLFKQFQPYPFWADPLLRSGFAIDGLSGAVQSALRLYIPSPSTCFSDTSGTTPAMQDGNVALWRDSLGKGPDALQATTGFQPKLRKGLVNHMLYSDTPSASWWLTSAASVSGNTVTESGTSAFLWSPVTLPAFANMTLAVELSRGNSDWVRVMVGAGDLTVQQVRVWVNLATGTLGSYGAGSSTNEIGISAASIKPLPNGNYLLCMNFSTVPARTTIRVAFVTAGGDGSTNRNNVGGGVGIGSTYSVYNIALLIGTYTVSNLPSYPKTQGSPLSNGVGNWWLDFDGVQTRMDFSAPLSTSNSIRSFTVASSFCNVFSGTQAIISTTGPASQRANSHFFNPAALTIFRDDAGVSRGYSHPVPSASNQPLVSSTRRDDTAFRNSANGTPFMVNGSFGNLTVSGSWLGHMLTGNVLNGGIYGVVAGDGVAPTDSEMVSIERYLGQLQGLNL